MKNPTFLEALKFLLLLASGLFLVHVHAPTEAFAFLAALVPLVKLPDQKLTPRGELDKPREDKGG